MKKPTCLRKLEKLWEKMLKKLNWAVTQLKSNLVIASSVVEMVAQQVVAVESAVVQLVAAVDHSTSEIVLVLVPAP